MSAKKNILVIFTITLIVLLMMALPVQALTVGTVYNLRADAKGNIVYFSWDKVSNVDGYDVYINTSNQGYEYIGSVNSNSATVIGFQTGKSYKAKVAAYVNNNGRKQTGSFSSEISVNTTERTTLGKVNTLTVSQSGNYASLNWSSVSNCTGYQVFADIPGWGYVNLGSVNGTSAFIQGAQSGQTYYFKVRAYKTTNGITEYGEFSPEKRFVINSNQSNEQNNNNNNENNNQNNETKPAQVKNLNVESIIKNKVTLSWSKVSDADGYKVYLSRENGSYYLAQTVYTNRATLTNLNYDTNYKAKIVAYKQGRNGTLYGAESSYVRFLTEQVEENVTVDTVKNVSVRVDENKANVSWSKISNADAYEVYIAYSTGNFFLAKTTSTNSAEITNLDYDTNYRVKVIAYKNTSRNKKYGNYSSIRSFKTEAKATIAQVTNLSVSNIAQNSATISWSRVTNARGYNIYVSKNNSSSFRYVKSTTGTSTTIRDLERNTKYYVKVSAYTTENGREKEGVASNYKQFTTKQDNKLSAATHISVSIKDRTEALVSWWAVDNADGYEVYLAESGRSFRKVETVEGASHVYLYSNLLDYNTSYEVKVRAYKYDGRTKIYANYSSVTRFRTERQVNSESNENVPRVSNLRNSVRGDAATLTWDSVRGAEKYEICFTVPGIGGEIKLYSTTNSKVITGLTNKTNKYTARVRAYKYVNGRLVAGPYSYVTEFSGK